MAAAPPPAPEVQPAPQAAPPPAPAAETAPPAAPQPARTEAELEDAARRRAVYAHAREVAASRPAEPAPRNEAAVTDVQQYPRLSSSDMARYGLSDMRLNVLREATPTRPEALAIINLNKVYVGEDIPGSDARLIGVARYGIAIEIKSTGARYYVEH